MKNVIPLVGVCCLAIVLFITLQNKEKISNSDITVITTSNQEPSYEVNSNIVSALEDSPEVEEAVEYIRQQFEQSETTLTDTNK